MARRGGRGAALSAMGLAVAAPAMAQPAPNARPQGGQVVAGAASIATSAQTTTINQSSNRAAIDWRSFDVGRNQSVVFQQPGATSVTLNRVTGPDPSAIAGRVSANGSIVLTNPSGVTFHAGAQVNAQSVIVSAPGITNQNFMAGRMVFDQPASPNARIENAGTITVKQAGLAALVAPSVANSGVITARMGHVVLAGAAAHTLDLYGDGLVAIDVTKQVTQAPVGPGGKSVTALVTNTGTIAADGGTVQLTARAADGVVSTLVQAGGTIRADTAGGRAGQIEIAGTGGSVVVEGRVAAEGRAPGSTGGTVSVAGSAATTVSSAARISADGRAGGGSVALGRNSARTIVAAGARVSADAKRAGDGGRVSVLSTASTVVAGRVTARGGRSSGNGGTIELSGESGFRLTGSADASAPHGALGTVLLDPRDLTITNTPTGTRLTPNPSADPSIGYADGGTTTDAYVTPAQLRMVTGNIRLQASRDLIVASDLNYGGGSNSSGGNLTLEAGRNLTVNSGVTISALGYEGGSSTVPGVTTLTAADSAIPGYDPAGTLSILGTINTSALRLSAGTGGIVLGGTLNTRATTGPNVINATTIDTPGAVVQTGGALLTGNLAGTAGSLSLTSGSNQIASIGGVPPSFSRGVATGTPSLFTATSGGVTVVDAAALTVGSGTGAGASGIGVAAGQSILLQTDGLTLRTGSAGLPSLSAVGGTVTLQPLTAGREIDLTSGSKPSGTLALTTSEAGLISAGALKLQGPSSNVVIGQPGDGAIDLVANGNAAQLQLEVGGSVTQNAALRVNGLATTGGATASSITLTDGGNSIPVVGTLAASGDVSLATSGGLTISAGSSLSSRSGTLALSAGAGGIALGDSTSQAPVLVFSTPGALTQGESGGGGAVVAGLLTGQAGSVSLTSRNNSVTAISSLSATAGDLTLVDRLPLAAYQGATTTPGASVPTGYTITLVTDGLSLGTGRVLSAPGGTVVVAPYTAGNGIVLTSGAKPRTGLSLTTAELGAVQAATLQLGGVTAGGAAQAAGAVTIGQPGTGPIDLGALGLTQLRLGTTGAVTQSVALGVNTLSGTAGSLALTNAGNAIMELRGFGTSAGDLALHTGSGLIVSAPVSGAGAVTLSATRPIPGRTDDLALLLASDLTAASLRLDATDGVGGAHGIVQTAGSITADSLTAAAGTLSLTGTNRIDSLGDVSASTAASVSTTRPLALTGAVTAPVVTLNAAGLTQAAGSSITATELDGASSAGTVLDSGLNVVSSIGSFAQTNGDFTLVTAAPELDFGAATGRVAAANGALTFVADRVGFVAAPAAGTSLSAATSISFVPRTAGRATALVDVAPSSPDVLSLTTAFRNVLGGDTLALGGPGATGAVALGDPGQVLDLSRFRSLQVQTSGAVTQGAGSDLILPALTGTAGAVTLPSAGNRLGTLTDLTVAGDLTLRNSIGLTLAGAISIAGTMAVDLAGPLAGGTLAAQSLTGSAGAVSLTGANRIGALGPFSSTGGFELANGQALRVAGPLSDATALALTITGDLVLAAPLASPAVTLNAGGSILQTGGAITADSLTGSASGSALFGDAGNAIATLAGFSTGGDFTLADGRSLVVSAPVDPTTIRFSIDGDLRLNSSVTGNAVALDVTGAISAGPGGLIVADVLTGRAGSAALGGANRVATLGAFATSGGFSLAGSGALTIAGPVNDPTGIAITAAGPVVLAGNVSAVSLTIATPGSVVQTGGAVSAGVLSGSAASLDLGRAGTASVGRIENLTASSSIQLVDTAALLVGGTVAAPRLSLSSTGATVLADGVTIRTNAAAFAVQPGADGTATVVQQGTAVVASLGLPFAALRLDLPAAGGTVVLNDLQAGAANITLNLGSGTATGTMTANNLTVLGANGQVMLLGTVAGFGGAAAARSAELLPGLDLRYTLNGCPISLASCSVLGGSDVLSLFQPASALASLLRPDLLVLDVLDLSVTRDRDDPTLLLPNISDRDY